MGGVWWGRLAELGRKSGLAAAVPGQGVRNVFFRGTWRARAVSGHRHGGLVGSCGQWSSP